MRGGKGSSFTEEQEIQYLLKDPKLNIFLLWAILCLSDLSQSNKEATKINRNDHDFHQYFDFPKYFLMS